MLCVGGRQHDLFACVALILDARVCSMFSASQTLGRPACVDLFVSLQKPANDSSVSPVSRLLPCPDVRVCCLLGVLLGGGWARFQSLHAQSREELTDAVPLFLCCRVLRGCRQSENG